MTPEWIVYANLALNLLLLPLLRILWTIGSAVSKLEVQAANFATETAYLRSEISGLRAQITSTAATAAAAAASAAAAAAAAASATKRGA